MPRIALLLALGLAGCSSQSSCASKILQVVRDPGSDRYATIEVRDCGATTGFATVVRVGRASEPQARAEDVFVADGDHGAAPVGPRGAVLMNAVWTANGKLSIAYASQARVFKNASGAKGATISYKASDPISLPPMR